MSFPLLKVMLCSQSFILIWATIFMLNIPYIFNSLTGLGGMDLPLASHKIPQYYGVTVLEAIQVSL